MRDFRGCVAPAFALLRSVAVKSAAIAVIVVLGAFVAGDPSAETLTVPPGGNLQDAINRAHPGDTILLERGAEYVGNFVLPARGPGSDEPITIRTSGDSGLPARGERITPAAAPQLAKLRSPNASPVIQTAPGARGWRLELLEIGPTRDGGDIIALGDGSSAQRSLQDVPSGLALDRLYIHGDPQRGQKRGVALNSSDTTITACYISDIKTIGQDSQAILGWNGPGNYVIENNYLEAAGDNIMFGGADPHIPNLTPTRIVVRRNLLSKPLSWRDPGAPKWQIKNLFELKNARDVLVEHNVMERSWAQAQTGYAVLFTVRNQDGNCPWCQVEDVRFRGNLVRDVAAGIQVLGVDNLRPSRETNNIIINDNVFDGIDKAEWGGDGYFLLISNSPRDVVVDHNTILQGASGGLIKISNGVASNMTFTNNIGGHGEYGIIGTNRGVGNDSIRAYLPGATITHNVIAGGRESFYPSGNFFPSMAEFRRQFANADAHDFHLIPGSPWLGAGTDRRDLGAALDRVPREPRDPREVSTVNRRGR
jgi:hypothetical protein